MPLQLERDSSGTRNQALSFIWEFQLQTDALTVYKIGTKKNISIRKYRELLAM